MFADYHRLSTRVKNVFIRCRAWWTQRQPRRNVLPFDRLADRRAGDWTDADAGSHRW